MLGWIRAFRMRGQESHFPALTGQESGFPALPRTLWGAGVSRADRPTAPAVRRLQGARRPRSQRGGDTPSHGVDITGEPLRRGIASLAAHAEYTKGLGTGGPEPGPMLTWFARQGGPAMGVEEAVLFETYQIAFEGPLPWA